MNTSVLRYAATASHYDHHDNVGPFKSLIFPYSSTPEPAWYGLLHAAADLVVTSTLTLSIQLVLMWGFASRNTDDDGRYIDLDVKNVRDYLTTVSNLMPATNSMSLLIHLGKLLHRHQHAYIAMATSSSLRSTALKACWLPRMEDGGYLMSFRSSSAFSAIPTHQVLYTRAQKQRLMCSLDGNANRYLTQPRNLMSSSEDVDIMRIGKESPLTPFYDEKHEIGLFELSAGI